MQQASRKVAFKFMIRSHGSTQDLQGYQGHCGSGFTREESDAVHGTGFAGVRG